MSMYQNLSLISAYLTQVNSRDYRVGPLFNSGTYTAKFGSNTYTTHVGEGYDNGVIVPIYYQTWDGYNSVSMRGYSTSGEDNITGGDGDDILWDNEGGGILDGGGGNDILITSDGSAYGDNGRDLLIGGLTIKTSNAGNFVQEWYNKLLNYQNMTEAELLGNFIITNADVTLAGMEGDDTLIATGGNDVLAGNAGADYIIAGDGNDSIYAGDARNTTSPDNDTVFGEGGNDFIFGGHGDDLLYGGTGDDTIIGDAEGLYDGPLVGNDSVFGEEGNDSIDGGAGDDYLDGGAGNDSLSGGAGNDTLLAGNEDTAANSNTLDGGDGNDLMAGGLGADHFIGGAGVDTVTYELFNMSVLASLADNTQNAYGAAGDTFGGVENLLGSGYNDALFGNAEANQLNGSGGNDTLDGGAGNDTLIGGTGNDLMAGSAGYDFEDGGAGNDTYWFGVGSGYDHIFEAAGGGTDNLYLAGITEVGVFRQGDDLLFVANNDDVIVLDNWYGNQAVEYIDFEALGYRYLVSDFAGIATEIPVSNAMYMAANDQGFITMDITALGVSPVGSYDSVDTSLLA